MSLHHHLEVAQSCQIHTNLQMQIIQGLNQKVEHLQCQKLLKYLQEV